MRYPEKFDGLKAFEKAVDRLDHIHRLTSRQEEVQRQELIFRKDQLAYNLGILHLRMDLAGLSDQTSEYRMSVPLQEEADFIGLQNQIAQYLIGRRVDRMLVSLHHDKISDGDTFTLQFTALTEVKHDIVIRALKEQPFEQIKQQFTVIEQSGMDFNTPSGEGAPKAIEKICCRVNSIDQIETAENVFNWATGRMAKALIEA
jgi:hypothetical protein